MPTIERDDAEPSTRRMPDGRSIVAAVGVVVLCWMLLMPQGSGPDEAGHLVRAGAVMRGEFGDTEPHSLPDRFQAAEPGCYAFQPAVPASCSVVPNHTGATLELPTRASEYPIWGHAVFGVLTVLPGLDAIWLARLGGGLVAAALVGAALAGSARDRPAVSAAFLLGLTPMAWSTFGTVNPSSISIAGAAALWVGLMLPAAVDHADRARWLTALGWVALVLPRRDGLVWACIALVIALGVTGIPVDRWWTSLRRAPQALIAAATLVTLVWGALSEARSTRFVVLAPALVVVAEVFRRWWYRPAQSYGVRATGAAVLAAVVAVGTYAVIDTRPGGWNTELAIDIVMQTDDNLVEAIGVFGWLDAAMPAGAVYLWLVALGMLAAAALAGENSRRALGWAGGLAAATVASSWVLELVQGNSSGSYWQGRYSLPLLIGVPLILIHRSDDRSIRATDDGGIGRAVGVVALFVLNVGAWSAARRFGVGTSGSLLPWRWDTAIQPVPPVLLLAAHAVATAWLAALLWLPLTDATHNQR